MICEIRPFILLKYLAFYIRPYVYIQGNAGNTDFITKGRTFESWIQETVFNRPKFQKAKKHITLKTHKTKNVAKKGCAPIYRQYFLI